MNATSENLPPREPNRGRGTTGLLLFVAALFLAAAAVFFVGTPETRAQEPVARFAVIGDFGQAGQPEADVAALVKSLNPDFIVTVGDNNYPSGSAATIDQNIGQYYSEFIYPYTGSFARSPVAENRFFPTLGNHDWSSTSGYQPYLSYFTLPNNERYYELARGPVHLFALNSDTHEPDGTSRTSVQANWLRQKLQASTAPWKLVFLHHPPYCSDGSTSGVRWPYHDWGATAVFAGHEHVYERLVRDGYLYFVNGLGGGEIHPMNDPITGSMFRYDQDYGAQLITAGSQSLTFEFFSRTGALIDSFTLGTPAPAAPGSLAAATVSSSKISLTWRDNSTTETGFKIERSTDGKTFSQVKAVGANVTSYLNTSLAGATTYTYRVRAYNAAGNSTYSNLASAQTWGPPTSAPSELTAASVSTSRINLAWKDNTTTEDGFKIERSANGGTFTQIKTVGANVTSYANSSLAAETAYTYRVRAYNAAGSSPYSNTASATTWGPAAPSGLTATAASSSRIDLVWQDNSAVEDGYQLYRSLDGSSFSLIASLGANVTSYAGTGLSPSTRYYYRVRAFNAKATSGYSNVASTTTLAQ
ncbi:MAG: fibronectin type III domain-containing protein [Armatimonadota bacterium]